MMETTMFHAKKILTKNSSGWDFDINLMFDGLEFALTEYPIGVYDEDAETLIPGLDASAAKPGEVYKDVIDIHNARQFCDVFRSVLTDDAAELLNDVYSGRSWSIRILDSSGSETCSGSILADMFPDVVNSVVGEHVPCWIEVSYCDTSFKDWEIIYGEPHVVFSNIHDGFAPMNLGEIMTTISRFGVVSRYSDREEFRTTVTKQGNSLVLKVTDQCRRMGIDVGDEVGVVMERGSAEDRTMLRAFYARNWTPIDDPDRICHRDGCGLDKVKAFLDEYHVVGTVNPGLFMQGHPSRPYSFLFDHVNFLKTASGENIIVSQPYSKGSMLKDAQEWARVYGCTVEEQRDRSWHHPPETTLLVFRLAENPDWRLPKAE